VQQIGNNAMKDRKTATGGRNTRDKNTPRVSANTKRDIAIERGRATGITPQERSGSTGVDPDDGRSDGA
jgi:hypothetical protein